MLRRMEQGVPETEIVTPATRKNSGRPRTVRTPANEDATIAAAERDNGEVEETSH
jgi:hypothetical protein